MVRIASVAVGMGITMAGITGTPAQAVTCEQTWNNTATRWEVRYECSRSKFDSHGIRRVKNSKGYYPAALRGKVGPRQLFRLRVTAPGFRGLWHFTGRIGGKRVTDGNLSIVGIHNKTLATGAIERINTDANGAQAVGEQGSGWDYAPAWSPDSTEVAFSSEASNLVPGDTNGTRDVFVKSLVTGSVRLVSADTTAAPGNDESNNPFWSPGGTKIGFDSESSNLVPGDTNASRDVFVKALS